MSKKFRRVQSKLEARQRQYDDKLKAKDKFKRPGSMNKRKQG